MALPILDGNQSATTLSTILDGGQHIPAHTVVSLGPQAISNITSAISGSVVSVSNFPSTQTVAGTVTANVGGIASGVTLPVRLFAEAESGPSSGQDTLVLCDSAGQLLINAKAGGASVLGYDGNAFVQVKQVSGSSVTVGNSVTIGSLPAISGTVTANLSKGNIETNPLYSYIVDPTNDLVYASDHPFPISGTVTVGNSVTISAMPNGALTTRFGSVTTANTAQITSAVTNTSRKYLLAQNISAGTVTIGIGFSPTTTQGIQLTAGAGLTFDAFAPTGAIYWLGAVTGAAFTILEG